MCQIGCWIYESEVVWKDVHTGNINGGIFSIRMILKPWNCVRFLTRNCNRRKRTRSYQELVKEWSGRRWKISECDVTEAKHRKCLIEQGQVYKMLSSGWVT